MNRPDHLIRLLSYFLGLFSLLNARFVGVAQTKQRITLDDLETLKEVSYLQLSPTADFLVYVLNGEIWLVTTHDDNVPRKLVMGTVPMWSPDGKRLAYYSSHSGTQQLWVLDLESDHAEQITTLEGGINPDPWTRMLGWGSPALGYSWSPDSTNLVFASQVALGGMNPTDDQRPQRNTDADHQSGTPLVLTNNTPVSWTLSGVFFNNFGSPRWVGGRASWDSTSPDVSRPPRVVNQFFIINVRSKRMKLLTNDNAVYFNPDWSPDGERILCASSDGRALIGFGSGTTNIYVIDIGTSRKIALTSGPGDKRLPRWSPDGKWVAYFGSEHFGHESVFVIPSGGGHPRDVTSKLMRSVQDFGWSSDGKYIFVRYQDGVSSPIARIDLQEERLQNVTRDEQVTRWPTTISRAGALAWQQSGPSSTGVIRILASGANSSKVLLDMNPQIKRWELGKQEIVRWRNRRGEEMEGILIKPVGYQNGRKYPLIVDGYPQLANGFMGSAMYGNQAWASRGYAIFYPNARGPHVWMNSFKSEGFDQAARGPKGWDVTADDVLSGVDELILGGIVDPDRMGLYGFSNGAAVVNALVTRTDRFKCAVSVSPATSIDWSQAFFLDTTNPLIPNVVGGTPWKNPYLYTDLSLAYQLDRVTTPMLLADGDDAVPNVLSSIEMYNGLRYLGKNVTLLRYPSQGHGFTGPALKDFTERIDSFFDRYLGRQEMRD